MTHVASALCLYECSHVTSVEFDADRARKLEANLRMLGLLDPHRPRVAVVSGDYTIVRRSLTQDCTFYDPPYVQRLEVDHDFCAADLARKPGGCGILMHDCFARATVINVIHGGAP